MSVLYSMDIPMMRQHLVLCSAIEYWIYGLIDDTPALQPRDRDLQNDRRLSMAQKTQLPPEYRDRLRVVPHPASLLAESSKC